MGVNTAVEEVDDAGAVVLVLLASGVLVGTTLATCLLSISLAYFQRKAKSMTCASSVLPLTNGD
jgi:hypothetical protein